MEQADMQTVVNVFKALAHESRLKIVGLLAEQEYSVSQLAELLSLKDPTVSHHLNKLHELGLVSMRQEGTTHYYRLDVKTLQHMNRTIFTPEKMAAFGDEGDSATWESKVLRVFVQDGTLKQIPDSYKKRLVILRWLVEDFEEGVRYPEKEVNEKIKQHHPDYATLRREMIGNRFMARENGVYWRLPKDVTEAAIAEFLHTSPPSL